ncbi:MULTISPECIES: PEPxxWA-CTERM sorting domain-containing protein [Sphingomonas]|jgi:hypothetical protein|nr:MULTISPECIES: PEPxxWA-CTERM sorting domain-containing protein [Sphingomonas]MBA2920436.1 PEPxxWA-CTERM sorting domain-containing protein [Sphingomonas sp. CGMCC 1.13658]
MLFRTFALAAAVAVAMPASAAVVGDFRLDGSLANQAGGALTLAGNGATLGATGLSFAANHGPTISGFASPADYSIEFSFRFDTTSGYRKLADFLNRGSDTGLYVHDGRLAFYNVTESASVAFAANQLATVVFTRAADGTSAGYVNGNKLIGFTSPSLTALQSDLFLFRDDAVNGGEASAGFVDYIRIYDTALSATEVAALTPPGAAPVPEPATWAMMIAGFGLAGAAARRRRTARVLA